MLLSGNRNCMNKIKWLTYYAWQIIIIIINLFQIYMMDASNNFIIILLLFEGPYLLPVTQTKKGYLLWLVLLYNIIGCIIFFYLIIIYMVNKLLTVDTVNSWIDGFDGNWLFLFIAHLVGSLCTVLWTICEIYSPIEEEERRPIEENENLPERQLLETAFFNRNCMNKIKWLIYYAWQITIIIINLFQIYMMDASNNFKIMLLFFEAPHLLSVIKTKNWYLLWLVLLYNIIGCIIFFYLIIIYMVNKLLTVDTVNSWIDEFDGNWFFLFIAHFVDSLWTVFWISCEIDSPIEEEERRPIEENENLPERQLLETAF